MTFSYSYDSSWIYCMTAVVYLLDAIYFVYLTCCWPEVLLYDV